MNRTILLQRATDIARALTKPDNIDQCCLCVGLVQEKHHVFPKEFGGPESGPLVNLCATHHTALHTFSKSLIRGVKPDSMPFSEQSRALKAFMLLVEMIINARLVSEGNVLPDQPRRIQFSVTHTILTQIHLRKRDFGFTSVQDYMLYLIRRDLGLKTGLNPADNKL